METEKQKRPYNYRAHEANWCRPLRDYVVKLDPEQQKRFAQAAGTTPGSLQAMMYGNRSISAERAIYLDLASKGAVSVFDMRPDIPWGNIYKSIGKKRKDKAA